MKFPGYWVSMTADKVCIDMTTFDETELDPDHDWKQAWQNQDAESPVKGYVGFADAIKCASVFLAKAENRVLSPAELDRISVFEPEWQGERCEIHSISQLLTQKTAASTSQS